MEAIRAHRADRAEWAHRSVGWVGVSAVLLLGTTGCWWDDDPGPPPTTEGSNLTEQEAIGLVKAYLDEAARPTTERRQEPTQAPCSAQQAQIDNTCRPCSSGSLTYCRDEWVWTDVAVSGRCPFPPSANATWTAEYRESSSRWEVRSSDPYATGLNRWTVDDPTATMLSGYCFP
jgi:hypothetical protein